MKHKLIVVWFSCGAASAVAAKIIYDKYRLTNIVKIVNNPIKEEHIDNIRFKKDVSKWLGCEIRESKNINFPDASITEVFKKKKYMSGVHGAVCTTQLKKEARYQFEKEHNIDYHVLGFTYEEIKRHERFIKFERSNVIPILIEMKLTKQDCLNILYENNIKPPEIYNLGFPNANCIGCVKSQSPTYWNLVRKEFPEVYKKRAVQSREIGCKLVKLHGKRIYLDELKSSDKGGKIKSYECSLFCN